MGKHAQESYVSTNFLTQANASSTYAPLASPTFTGTVTVPAPVNATDAVTKQYADAIAEGLHIHAAVGAATTTNINLSSPPATIDGVTLVDTMRVLVKDQGTTSENGIYVYNSASSSLTRALDFDTPAETDGGDFVFVTGGNTYDNTGWVQTETVTTIGTSPILFTQFSGAGTYTAGTGLSLNGTEFSNTGVLSLTGTANEVEVSASAGSITISLPSTINADTTGSAASLTTSRAIEVTGDVSGSASFNGTANVSISATLANSGVTGASYGSASAVGQFTVDSKGRLTAASNTPIAIDQSAVTNLTSDLSGKVNDTGDTITGELVISANTSGNALRVTQTGAGNALVVEDSANLDATPFVVDASGQVGIGQTPAANITLHVERDSGGNSRLIRNSSDANSFNVQFLKRRGTSASPAIVNDGDELGRLTFNGYDGSAQRSGAAIIAGVDGTPGSSDMPGRLMFYTTADGSTSLTERMRIDNAGNVGIGKTPAAEILLDVNGKGTFSDILTAPTAAVDTNTTQVATTAYVVGQGYLKSATASSTYAPLASPTFTGTVSASAVNLSIADTATAASHYMVETGSDGVVRPKTLANVQTEIVTNTQMQSSVVSPTAAGSNGIRKITISTSAPTGGTDGDVWLVYV